MYVATRDEEITLDAPFLTVPFTFSLWLQHKGRIIDIQNWFKVTGAEMATLYEFTYRCNHKGGFVGNLLRLCYRFLMYAEPGGGDNSNILVYTELSDQRVAVKLHDLNWFASSDNDRSQDYVVSELSVDALFTESSLEKVAASAWPYVPETKRNADHAFRPNKLLRSCVHTVFRDIFEKSRDVRSADIRNIATPVRLMSFYEFVIARLVPTLTKYGVDTHAKVNRHFWATAVDAAISAYALGDPEKPSRYDEWMRYSRFYAAFTGTFWGMDPRAWSRAEWFAFVRNPHDAMSTYYGFLRPDRVIVQASLYRLDWLKEKCLQVYVQTFYYKSRNIDKKVTFSKLKYSFRSSSDYPDWLSVIEFEVPRADALNAARVVWTAIARLRSVVEVGLRFEMLPHVEPYLGRFARNYFTREEAELLSGSDYTNLNLRDDEFMDFLFHSKGKVTCTEVFSNEEEEEEEERPRRKRSVLSPGKGRPKGSAVLTERLAQGLFAIAVEMSRGNSDGVRTLVETYVPYKTNSLRLTYDSRDDEWSLSRRCNGRYSKLGFDFHVERESALRPATIRDVICEMAMGNLETFSAFALKLFDVYLEKGNDSITPNPWILEAPARMGTNPLRECQTVTARDLVDMNVFSSAEVAATYRLYHGFVGGDCAVDRRDSEPQDFRGSRHRAVWRASGIRSPTTAYPEAHRPPPTPRLTDHRLPPGSPTTAYPPGHFGPDSAHRPPPTPRLTDHRLAPGSPTTAYPPGHFGPDSAHRPPPTPRLTDHRLAPGSPTTAYPQAHRPPPTPQATSDPTRLTDHRLPPGSPTTAYPPGHFGPDSAHRPPPTTAAKLEKIPAPSQLFSLTTHLCKLLFILLTEYRLSERFWALALPEVKSLLIERRTRSKTLDYLGMYCNLSRPDNVRDFVASISDKGYNDFRVPARLLNPVVIASPCVPLVDGREDVDAPDE
ncbi:uncharacterized protein ISCGN_018682 [Ixodes scapularis]